VSSFSRLSWLVLALALVPAARGLGAHGPERSDPTAAPTGDAALQRDLFALPQRLWESGASPHVAAHALAAGRAWIQGHRGEALAELRHAAVALRDVLGREGDAGWLRACRAQADVLRLGTRAALAAGHVDDLVFFLETARGSALFTHLVAEEGGYISEGPDIKSLRAKESWIRAREARAFANWREAHADGSLTAIRKARSELERIGDQAGDARHEIERASWCLGDQPLPEAATIRDLQRALDPDQVLVQYALLSRGAWALVIRARRVRLVRLAPTNRILAAARRLDVTAPEAVVEAAAATLRRLLVEPLGLEKSDRRLVLVPDGRTAALPYVLLMPVWLRMHADLNRRGMETLAVGGPDYGRGANGLPLPIEASGQPPMPLEAAAREVRRVGDEVKVGSGATETALRQALASTRPWSAIHLACHGLVSPDPERCALALTPSGKDDGILTVPEIEQLDVNADLVVLSACHSGEGPIIDPEGCVSLARAFLVAGAPCVLASLGSVDDEATEAMMLRFHAWYRQEVPADEALRRAQAHVRAQPKWRHPRYWACWTLWGVTE
jgi:hypothetical protein